MYESFYGLERKPFDLTPNPRFLYLTAGHREALSQLLYGVRERRGFISLIGEVGTGKTTLLQALLERIDANTRIAFVFNSSLPFEGIVEYMLEDFGITRPASSLAQRLFALNSFLIEQCRKGQNAVLIIDEAQNLSPATLEQIRLLSNFESRTEKLMQIMLVGQPELRETLALPALRQLRQRISLRSTISALTDEETEDYIRHRLIVAGAGGRALEIFSRAALARIASYAQGIPRMINIVCDHCLITGYADQRREIDADVVGEAIAYLEQSSGADLEIARAGSQQTIKSK